MIYKSFDALLASGRRWPVIYADPAWDFSNSNLKRANGEITNIKDYYKTLGKEGLKALPIGQLAEDTAALFVWTTDAHVEWALECGKAWGFKYATLQFAWLKKMESGKDAVVMGPWGLKSVENCLLFTRGKVRSTMLCAHNVRQVPEGVRGAHSVKPEHFAREIDRMFPLESKLELFARRPRDGWDVMGDEL